MMNKWTQEKQLLSPHWALYITAFSIAFSIIGFLFLYWYLNNQQLARSKDLVSSVIEYRISILQSNIQNQLDDLTGFEAWISSTPNITQTDLSNQVAGFSMAQQSEENSGKAFGLMLSDGKKVYTTPDQQTLNELREYWKVTPSDLLEDYRIFEPYELSDGRWMVYFIRPLRRNVINGYTDTALDISDVIQPLRMNSEQEYLTFALRNRQDQVIGGDITLFDRDPLIRSMDIYDLHWDLAVAPKVNWRNVSAGFTNRAITLIFGIFFVFNFIFYHILKRQQVLILDLQRRANELKAESTERINTAEKLAKSETILLKATRHAHIGIWEYDHNTRLTYFSDELFQIIGIAPAKTQLSLDTLRSWVEDLDQLNIMDQIQRVFLRKTPIDFELPIKKTDGTSVELWVTANPKINPDGEIVGVWGLVQDITPRKSVQRELQTLNRALQMVFACDQEIVRAKNELDLLENICHIITETGGYKLTWIGEAEKTPQKDVHILATSGDITHYLDQIHLSWDDSPQGNGPTGKAIKSNKIVISKDLANDPDIAWKTELLKSSFHSAISIPLEIGQNSQGVISIYSERRDAFSPDEEEILSRLARDLSYGISSGRAQREYQSAVDALRVSEDKFSKIFEISPNAIGLSDADTGIYIDVNEGFCLSSGYAKEEIIGKSALELGIWNDIQDRDSFYARFSQDKQSLNQEIAYKKKDGSIGYGVISARLLRLNDRNFILSIVRDITERKMNENALRISEERYRLITENMAEIVWLIDSNYQISYVSPAVNQYLGYSNDELIGRKITSLLTNESMQLVAHYIQNYQNEKTNNNPQIQKAPIYVIFIRRDGTQKQNEITISLLKDEISGSLSWLCVGRDISDRVAMETALKVSEQRWQYALEGNGDGVWDWNLKDGNIYFSPRIYAMLGYQPTEVWKNIDDWSSHVHPEDSTMVWDILNDYLIGNTPDYQCEFRILCADGSYKWILDRGRIIAWNETGQPVRMVGTHTDMSEQRAMIFALGKSEEQYRMLAERSTDMISRHNIDGKFFYISPACEKILGFSPSEMLSKKLLDLIHPEDRTLVKFVLDRLDEYQEIQPLQFRMAQKQGTFLWVESSAIVIRSSVNGEISELQVTTRDISARVFAENALRESEEKLRSLISQSADGIILVDEEGKIIEWSKGQERLTGLPAAKAMGELIWDIQVKILPKENQTAERKSQILKQMKEVLQIGSYSSSNFTSVDTIEREDGSQLIVQTTTFPIHTPHGYMAGAISRDITSIKNAEKALQKSEERLRFITNNMIDMVTYIDQNRVIQYTSPSVSSSIGYSDQELLGKVFDELIHPDDTGMISSKIISGIDQQLSHIQVEYRIKNARGVFQWMESLINLVYDEQNHYSGAILGTRDISERKISSDALKESEVRYRTLARNFPNGMVMLFDRDCRFIIADGIGLLQLGYSREMFEGHTLSEVFPREISSELETYYLSALNGISEVFEMQFNNYTIQLYTVPVHDDTGRIIGGLMMTQDITDRKNAVIALSSRAQFLSSLNEITRIALETSDTDMLVQQLTDLIALMFDADDSYITAWDAQNNRTIPLAASGAMRDTFRSSSPATNEVTLTQTVLESGQAIVVDDDLFNPTFGSSLIANKFPSASILALPLIGGGQKLGAALIGFTKKHKFLEDDITQAEQVAAQIALGLYKQKLLDEVRIYNQELEKRVAERTADLEAKNKELETFTYSVSHDLKAPLRGIDGYSRLLMEDHSDRLDPEGLSFLMTIRQATIQMSQLIEDLLSYSRLERRALTANQVNLHYLIEEILRERKDDIEHKNIKVIFDVPEDELRIDEKALEQAVRNLVDNAIKFTSSEEKPIIEIRLKSEASKYILIVKDNGIGFDMKYHDKIFDIFQRLHLAEDYPGTGIGLALVKKAMHRIGGKAWAESQPGKGSTFYLEFSGEMIND